MTADLHSFEPYNNQNPRCSSILFFYSRTHRGCRRHHLFLSLSCLSLHSRYLSTTMDIYPRRYPFAKSKTRILTVDLHPHVFSLATSETLGARGSFVVSLHTLRPPPPSLLFIVVMPIILKPNTSFLPSLCLGYCVMDIWHLRRTIYFLASLSDGPGILVFYHLHMPVTYLYHDHGLLLSISTWLASQESYARCLVGLLALFFFLVETTARVRSGGVVSDGIQHRHALKEVGCGRERKIDRRWRQVVGRRPRGSPGQGQR